MVQKITTFIKSNFQYYIFIILAIAIPFTKSYLPHLMLLWVISGILSIRQFEITSFKHKILLIFPFLFFIVHLLGLSYSENLKSGLFDIEVKLSFLFIPLVAIFITEKVKINYRLILKLFVYGNLIASLICICFAFFNSIQFNEIGNLVFKTSVWPTLTNGMSFFQLINHRYSYFSYSYLSIFHHPSYFSVYILFSIFILVYLIQLGKTNRLISYILIIYFSIFIWLLGSRAAYITYLIGFSTFFVILVLKYKKYWIALAVFGVGIFISIITISNKQLSTNVNETIAVMDGESINNYSDMRLRLWKSGFEIFKENLLFGVGVGDLDKEMSAKYVQYNFDLEKEHIHNPHNQYLTEAATLGLVGLIIFAGWIITTLIITIKRKQFLFFYFMLIVAVNLFFESMLNLIAGIAFFVFFYGLLYAMYNADSSKST